VTVIMFNLQVMMCCNLGYNAVTGQWCKSWCCGLGRMVYVGLFGFL